MAALRARLYRRAAWTIAIGIGLLVAGCNLGAPQITPTVAPTRRPTSTPFFTVTPAPSYTPSRTPTRVVTLTAALTASATATGTATLTLTRTPTETATPSPTVTPTDSPTFAPTETPTRTPTPTHTSAPTDTATVTSTASPTRTPTRIPTVTPSATFTDLPTAVPTATATATYTTPPKPTAAPTPSPTFSPTPTATFTPVPTRTPLPTETPSPTVDTFALTLEWLNAAMTLNAFMFTATANAPTLTPTATFIPTETPPTLDVTPTFITAAPDTAIAGLPTPPPEIALPTAPPEVSGEASPTPIPPTELPTFSPTDITLIAVAPSSPPAFATAQPQVFAYALRAGGGSVSGRSFDLPGGAARFSRSPQTGLYARVDGNGLLFVNADPTSGGQRLTTSPFSNFVPESREANNAVVGQLAWSPDGRWLAYLVDTEADSSSDNDSINDGLWLYLAAENVSRQLVRDCPPQPGCLGADRTGGPFQYRSRAFAWNYSSSALLLSLTLPEEGERSAFMVVRLDQDPNVMPPVYRYDDAAWSRQQPETVIASGRAPDGRIGIFRVTPTREGLNEATLFSAGGGIGWVQNAVDLPSGLYALAGASAGGPLALYRFDDGAAAALTGPIGAAPPVRVEWSPDRSAVLVVTEEGSGRRFFVAQINGMVREITGEVAGALAVEWETGG